MTDEVKFKRLYRCLNKWLQCAHEDKYLADFLAYKSVFSVGIYGYGVLGKHAVRELSLHDFSILWVADRREIDVEGSVPTYIADQVGDALQPDIIIITAVTDTEEIEKKLQKHFSCQIVTVEELITCVLEWGNSY